MSNDATEVVFFWLAVGAAFSIAIVAVVLVSSIENERVANCESVDRALYFHYTPMEVAIMDMRGKLPCGMPLDIAHATKDITDAHLIYELEQMGYDLGTASAMVEEYRDVYGRAHQ